MWLIRVLLNIVELLGVFLIIVNGCLEESIMLYITAKYPETKMSISMAAGCGLRLRIIV